MIKETDLRIGNVIYYQSSEDGLLPNIVDWEDLKWLSEKPDNFNKLDYMTNVDLKNETPNDAKPLLPAGRFISRNFKNNKMSLDVYLSVKDPIIKKASSGIFVRENGQTKEITQEEWNAKNPNSEPVKFLQEESETNEVYSANITHNLNTMAGEAGIYEHLWRPDEIKITKASELIEPLRQGLHNLKSEPERYKKFNPKNGWGSYDGLVKFVENYLNACYEYPDADVEVSR